MIEKIIKPYFEISNGQQAKDLATSIRRAVHKKIEEAKYDYCSCELENECYTCNALNDLKGEI